MARNLLYEDGFVQLMHKQFDQILSRVKGMSGGNSYGFLPRSADLYTVYALDGCPHSEAAIRKVQKRRAQHKTYYVKKDLGMQKEELRDILARHTDIPMQHNTWPIVYREGRFLGGNDSL